MTRKKTAEVLPTGPTDLNLINRAYNARMRDAYFLKSERLFGEFYNRIVNNLSSPDLALLSRFCVSVTTARDFARQAAFGMQSQSHQLPGSPAFFKEEILFIHLLEELHSSCNFLKARFNTMHALSRYRQKISGLIRNRKGEGYLSKILRFLKDKLKSDETEIRQILKLILERMHTSHRIFDIIKIRKAV